MVPASHPRQSAGLLLFRRRAGVVEVFLAHPGGPFWARKDLGAWSIPKGEFAAGEDPLEAARREWREEVGREPEGPFLALEPVRQAGGKMVYAWAVEGDADAGAVRSNTFTMEWPRGSGRLMEFPEIDRAAWFDVPEAHRRILPSQGPLLDHLEALVADTRSRPRSPR